MLRRAMKAHRSSLSVGAKTVADAEICKKLMARLDIVSPVAVYLASAAEITIDSFISYLLEKGFVVVSPRWNGETYELARLKGLDEKQVRGGPMNIREPVDADIVSPDAVNAWIVPGLAFTKTGKRLGYGGGWYDRFLAASSKTSIKVGIAYSFQVLDDLPNESHDIVVTDVLTD